MNQDALKDVCLRYLDRDLSDQELLEFNQLIAESEEAARMLARLSINDSHFEFTTTFAINRMTEQQWHARLTEGMDEMEELALDDPGVVKRMPRQWLAAAAVLLLGAALLIVLIGPGGDNSDEMADGSEASLGPAVATLITEYDAVWDRRPGEDLYTGQQFTLTQGFAEIQTRLGAVAIIEAPATIELLNHNALSLHGGKLVGICETDTSKGFLVRTPHMDITDLGTRFGVDASQAEATAVHVLEGEVEVVGVSKSGEREAEPQQLTAGHALRGDAVAGVTPVEYEAIPFDQGVKHFSYRPEVEGAEAIWRGQVSGDLSLDARQVDAMQVFIERRGMRLQRDTAVDFADDRVWTRDSVPGQQIVSEGNRVDVYLLHLDPRGVQGVNGEYTIRFGRPILGVIAHEDTLIATDATLGAAGTTYPAFTGKRPRDGGLVSVQRGLDIALQERASLTAGASVLHLESGAVEFADQIRVLVQAVETED